MLDALDELLAVGRANILDWVGVMTRVEQVRALRSQSIPYKDMARTDGLSIIAAVTANQERLTAAAARFRRATARELHDGGMSAAEVARVFGVSRQRIGALLQDGEIVEVHSVPLDE